MTESIYKEAKLVQLTPAGEWYVAISHPDRPDVLAVDTGKNLTFAAEFEPETLATVQPVLALNRFIDLRLEFIPGLFEGSAFNLLALALYRASTDMLQLATNPRSQFMLLTLLKLQAALRQSLHKLRVDTMTTQLSFGYLQQQQTAAMLHRHVCDLPPEERPFYPPLLPW